MQIWRDTSEKDLEGEVWKVIPEAPDYMVSSAGRLKVTVYRENRNGRHFWPGKIITQTVSDGYPKCNLVVNSESLNFRTHRLVAEAFVPNPDDLPQVNHKDGCKWNNSSLNLEWLTASENTRHAHATGLVTARYGENNPNSKLTASEAEEILHQYFFQFKPLKEIGETFGIKPEYASLITRGKRWPKVFQKFVKEHKFHYDKASPLLKERNGSTYLIITEELNELAKNGNCS